MILITVTKYMHTCVCVCVSHLPPILCTFDLLLEIAFTITVYANLEGHMLYSNTFDQLHGLLWSSDFK